MAAINTKKAVVPKLRFKVPVGRTLLKWEEKLLGDLIEIGSSKRVLQEEWKEEGVPFLRTREIIDLAQGNEFRSPIYISEHLFNSLKSKYGVPKHGDILCTGVGTIGEVYIVKETDKFYFKDGNVIWFKMNVSLSSEYIYQLFNTRYIKKQLLDNASITTVATYTIDRARKTKVILPHISEQQKIASFLSAVDDKIRQLTRKKELLEQYKKGVMQQLFWGKLRFKDDKGKAFPEWEEKRLGDVCDFFSGGTPASTNKEFYSGNIPFIGSGNIHDSYVTSFITETALNSSSAKTIEKGDLLYALYGANSGEVAISKIAGAINQAILCIRSNENVKYLYYVLLHNKDVIVSKYLQGGQGNLSANIIKKLKYKFPSLEEQQKIATYLSSIDSKIERISGQIEQTQTFKKGLLQQMFV